MSTSVKACALGAWRLRHAKLTQQEAAERAGIPPRHATAIESNPSRATVGALASYVAACGGKLECFVEIRGVRWLLVLLAVLLAGCGGAVDDPLEPPAGFCDTYRCEAEVATFAPAPELEAVTESILARLRKVTGRDDLRVDPAGVPIESVSGLLIVWEGKPDDACGFTTLEADKGITYTQRVQLNSAPPDGCARPEVVLAHELIHALAPHAEHTDPPSLFALHVDSWHAGLFDGAAAAALCGEFRCEAFAPENPEGL